VKVPLCGHEESPIDLSDYLGLDGLRGGLGDAGDRPRPKSGTSHSSLGASGPAALDPALEVGSTGTPAAKPVRSHRSALVLVGHDWPPGRTALAESVASGLPATVRTELSVQW